MEENLPDFNEIKEVPRRTVIVPVAEFNGARYVPLIHKKGKDQTRSWYEFPGGGVGRDPLPYDATSSFRDALSPGEQILAKHLYSLEEGLREVSEEIPNLGIVGRDIRVFHPQGSDFKHHLNSRFKRLAESYDYICNNSAVTIVLFKTNELTTFVETDEHDTGLWLKLPSGIIYQSFMLDRFRNCLESDALPVRYSADRSTARIQLLSRPNSYKGEVISPLSDTTRALLDFIVR